ncbi:DUF3147 family protein [Allokutzneria oryzae]|uniref:DUF3147 family protein n=1 Tax=Allokutzneria oryzae TaxID=1378989 RepID=A0ABV6A529_9PSEU
MTDTVIKVLIKALAGGFLVLAFTAVAEVLTPKRLAGVFSAAPSVALASLVVTTVFDGPADVTAAAHGMVVGAAAFTVYCLVAVPLVKRWGALRGSGVAVVAWLAAATLGYLVAS